MNRTLLTMSILGLMLLWASPIARSAEAVSLYPIQTVAGSPGSGHDVGQYSRLAHDPAGGQHVVYYDASYGNLNYAHRSADGRPWTIEAIDTAGDVGRWCALAIGPYQDTVGAATVVAGSRDVEITSGTMPTSVVAGGQFKIEPSGAWFEVASIDAETSRITLTAPYGGASESNAPFRIRYYQPTISYQGRTSAGNTLRVATPQYGGAWTISDVDPPTTDSQTGPSGFETDIAIDSFNHIHIAYQDRASTASTSGRLRYAVFNGIGWQTSSPLPADSVTGPARIVVDSTNHPWLFCRSVTDSSLKALELLDGAWIVTLIASGDRAGTALDAMYWPIGDQILLTYQARLSAGADPCVQMAQGGFDMSGERMWVTQMIANPGPGLGDYTSVAHGPTTGTQQVVFYDAINKHLLLTRPVTPGSTVYTDPLIVDGGADAGRYCSAEVSPADDALYAAYYDAFALGLKMARNTGTTESTKAFIDGLKAGTYSDVGKTAAEIVIPYYNASEGNLHVARWPIAGVPGDGSDVVVDNVSRNVGEYVSMAIDRSDRIWLVYYDRANTNLRLAAWDGSRWLTTALGDTTKNIGEYCRVVINPTGDQLAIAWRDADAQALSYATMTIPATLPDPFTFTLAPGTLGAGTGRYLSLAWGEGSDLHAAYFNDKTYSPAYSLIGTSTTQEAIETSTYNVAGWFTSVALNPATKKPAVAYLDVTRGALKYAERTEAGKWTVTTVDDQGETGFYPVLRFDETASETFLLYYNQTDGNLMMISKSLNSGCWRDPLVLASGSRGVRPAMAADADGRFMITLYHQEAGDLLYMLTTGAPIVNAARGWLQYR